jgi:hypothetical protein
MPALLIEVPHDLRHRRFWRCLDHQRLFIIATTKAHAAVTGGRLIPVDPRTHASDITGELEMGAKAVDIGKDNRLHPTLGESICMAAEVNTAKRCKFSR